MVSLNTSLYYDKAGRPISRTEFAKLLDDDSYRQIVRSELPGGITVSTVWLGIDHNIHGKMPIIFETMVFEGSDAGDCMRYATETEAIRGHMAMVLRLGGTVEDPPEEKMGKVIDFKPKRAIEP